MAPNAKPLMLHPDAPAEAIADQYVYAAWRYGTLSPGEAADLKHQGLSVAQVLAVFRDEWRASHAIREGGLP